MQKAEERNQNLPPPKSFPRIEFRGLRTKDRYPRADFVMTNDTNHSFVYEGYEADSPIYKLQRWNGHWEAASGGWCGVGLGPRLLEPSESIDFSVDVLDQSGRIRLGIRYLIGPSDKGKEVWSEEVALPARSLGVPPSRTEGAVAMPSADVIPPVLVEQLAPAYPEVLARAHITGRVLLKAVIDEVGKVTGVEVVKSSDQPAFDDAALTAVMTWRYTPATSNGRAVRVLLDIDVRFELSKDKAARIGGLESEENNRLQASFRYLVRRLESGSRHSRRGAPRGVGLPAERAWSRQHRFRRV